MRASDGSTWRSATRGLDARRSLQSSYCSCSTTTVVVALCLVAVWMASSLLVTPAEFSLFQPKVRPLAPHDSPTTATGGLPNAGEGDTTGEMERDVPLDPVPAEGTTHDDPPPVTQQVLPVKKDTATESSADGANQQQDIREQVKPPDEQSASELKEKLDEDEQAQKENKPSEPFPNGSQAELLNETTTERGSWPTQAAQSNKDTKEQTTTSSTPMSYSWKLCNVDARADYIPCLDNVEAIKKLRSTKHYEHRERHCPEKPPSCLVPLPEGYRNPIRWPKSRDQIWYNNVPHTKLVEYKGHQNWVKVSGEYLTFPGGGTQFKRGALHYIDFIQEAKKDIAWGKRSRVVLDVGCGVASFGGYLFERDVITMSFAPKDEHEAQVQFALERGIPAISAVMGGKLLLELDRLLRPGGYFVWSATPVYQKLPEDVEIWEAMSALTKSMCWKMVNKVKDRVNRVGIAIFRKPTDNSCYESRSEANPPLCGEYDDPDAAWNVSLRTCMHKLPVDPTIRGSKWPELWPLRLEKPLYWLKNSEAGVYGKPAPDDFHADYEHWKRVVSNSYMNGLGVDWSAVRNVMDMKAVYGGFAAALHDLKVWVMNVIPIDSPDTLPIIYERGLFGLYHDWCESFNTYPRTYDLLHANHLFSKVKKRCELLPVVVEVDRVLRPEGRLIVRDNIETISEVENIVKSLHWEVRMSYSQDKEGLLLVQKTSWRPNEIEAKL
ncbi:putative methyltransferase PMT26 [Dichanthelium oligosanthes]|uniref:Methyltransferase n=1 Tax=Dichanthelium oligosanthes TaxID=888268 RepID=A0A1E5W2N2_9POAL|nr:putative methyltransferase PMT26 [Dichanthelium oligosanthes]